MDGSSRGDFRVFDDVLPPADFQALVRWVRALDYAHVHSKGVHHGFWRVPDDGNPLLGPCFGWPSVPMQEILPPGVSREEVERLMRVYPTHTALDAALAAIKARVESCVDLVGEELRDWIGLWGAVQAYAAGTGLSWHGDDRSQTGAFVFYAHPVWRGSWGGELLVLDGVRAEPSRMGDRLSLGDEGDPDPIVDAGVGSFVVPKPNRLVIMAPGYLHSIAKVAPAAGNHMRVALSGMFIKRGYPKKLLPEEMRHS